MAFIGIIPARYASTRFPGKPLALINGIPMIQRVYEQVIQTPLFDFVIVATDDERIRQVVNDFGGNAMMTSTEHQSGTDRCGEVAQVLELKNEDIVINIQGDEPFIRKEEIELLAQQFHNQNVSIATLVKRLEIDFEDISNPNLVKVVFDKNGKALYFSRYAIPFVRSKNNVKNVHYKHIGMYGYRYDTLRQIIQLSKTPLEDAENLEQLRWLESGFSIHIAECHYESLAIDTPDDLLKIN